MFLNYFKNNIVIIAVLFYPIALSAQITISPEVGVSYYPFSFNGANTDIFSKKINLLFGFSAQLPIANSWYINTRVSYTDREDFMWQELCTCPEYEYSKFRQSDLNIDFSMNYELKDWLHLGVGPSIIYRLDTGSTYFDTSVAPEPVFQSESRFEYGLQGLLSFDIKWVLFKVEYAYKLFNYELDTYRLFGRNRYNATMAVPIFRSENNR